MPLRRMYVGRWRWFYGIYPGIQKTYPICLKNTLLFNVHNNLFSLVNHLLVWHSLILFSWGSFISLSLSPPLSLYLSLSVRLLRIRGSLFVRSITCLGSSDRFPLYTIWCIPGILFSLVSATSIRLSVFLGNYISSLSPQCASQNKFSTRTLVDQQTRKLVDIFSFIFSY